MAPDDDTEQSAPVEAQLSLQSPPVEASMPSLQEDNPVINGMTLETALKGMADAKAQLSQRTAIDLPLIMSEHMDRLAAYTSNVEDHLAQFESDLELAEASAYKEAVANGKSPSAAETVAKYGTAELKGNVKRLTRLVNSAWRLIDEKRSRFNHLQIEIKNQI